MPERIREDQARKYCVDTQYGTFTLDVDTLTATSPLLKEGAKVSISITESIILETLLQQPTRVHRHHQLVDAVNKALGRESLPNDNTAKWHVSNLRNKLGIILEAGTRDFRLLKNIKGIGYVFLPESDLEATSEG